MAVVVAGGLIGAVLGLVIGIWNRRPPPRINARGVAVIGTILGVAMSVALVEFEVTERLAMITGPFSSQPFSWTFAIKLRPTGSALYASETATESVFWWRCGFRVFVLGPASRRDILLGKNLAVAPLALGMGLAPAIVLQMIYPMSLDYFLALPFLFVSMYLAFCLLANLLSILAPHPLGLGTLKPVKMTGSMFLFHLAFTFLVPVVLAPTLSPLGVAVALAELGGVAGWPICLPLALVECVAVVYLYRMALHSEGRLLQAREQKILAVVAIKEE